MSGDRGDGVAGAASALEVDRVLGFEPVPMAPFTRWEYRADRHVARGPLEGLAELGAEGWELVAVSPTNMTGDMMLWFKRPVP